ncbi:hypothetical protein TRSC58_07318 [Trypanosoma rangeli SC58]|uniref:Transmembrane protein n=1 Tax=Trypanosoma rangeli SC58 TaxID=429131 RepID=A0A061IRP7_TRYRA|nr:hypothetical protein TRSC58_07318 [Trypanosoma rangeli SC58]
MRQGGKNEARRGRGGERHTGVVTSKYGHCVFVLGVCHQNLSTRSSSPILLLLSCAQKSLVLFVIAFVFLNTFIYSFFVFFFPFSFHKSKYIYIYAFLAMVQLTPATVCFPLPPSLRSPSLFFVPPTHPHDCIDQNRNKKKWGK